VSYEWLRELHGVVCVEEECAMTPQDNDSEVVPRFAGKFGGKRVFDGSITSKDQVDCGMTPSLTEKIEGG
jgi:hypothetical protein